MLVGGHWVALFLAAFFGLFLVVISYTWVGVSNVWSLSQTLLQVTREGNLQSLSICSSQGPSRFQQICKDSYGQVHTFKSTQTGESFPDSEGIPGRDLSDNIPTAVRTIYVTMPPRLARITQDQAPPSPETTMQTTQQTTLQTTLLTVVSQQTSSSSVTSTTTTSESDTSATSTKSTDGSTSAKDTDGSSASTTASSTVTSSSTTVGGVVVETKKGVVWQDADGSNPSTSIASDSSLATSTAAPS